MLRVRPPGVSLRAVAGVFRRSIVYPTTSCSDACARVGGRETPPVGLPSVRRAQTASDGAVSALRRPAASARESRPNPRSDVHGGHLQPTPYRLVPAQFARRRRASPIPRRPSASSPSVPAVGPRVVGRAILNNFNTPAASVGLCGRTMSVVCKKTRQPVATHGARVSAPVTPRV